jgi:hypothetical protein
MGDWGWDRGQEDWSRRKSCDKDGSWGMTWRWCRIAYGGERWGTVMVRGFVAMALGRELIMCKK